jgi:hypothetical protein
LIRCDAMRCFDLKRQAGGTGTVPVQQVDPRLERKIDIDCGWRLAG